jgi:hypothetical protein
MRIPHAVQRPLRARLALLTLLSTAWSGASHGVGATLEVGPGKPFARIEDANSAARPGDVILVYPLEGGRPYAQTAVYVTRPRLTFRAVPSTGHAWVTISGDGFEYSGRGSTPRAIFQFNRGADDCVLEGFELRDAHNGTHNGAGVRINQANHVRIRNCLIHRNDMGIMSNGDGTLDTAMDQLIEFCQIHSNGALEDPGYNHNLYLGGTSVLLRFCDIHSSLTGHNIKSRAHQTHVHYCSVRHSANRELDLVDADDTVRPASHAVLLGNVIAKDPNCRGNRGVIHFGQDGGKEHDGTLHLVFNTIVTPFVAPVVELSSTQASACLTGNLVVGAGRAQRGQQVARARDGASLLRISGRHNWFWGDFVGVDSTGLDAGANRVAMVDPSEMITVSEGVYRLTAEAAVEAVIPLTPDGLDIPLWPGAREADVLPPLSWQYAHPAGRQPRRLSDPLVLGAFGVGTE